MSALRPSCGYSFYIHQSWHSSAKQITDARGPQLTRHRSRSLSGSRMQWNYNTSRTPMKLQYKLFHSSTELCSQHQSRASNFAFEKLLQFMHQQKNTVGSRMGNIDELMEYAKQYLRIQHLSHTLSALNLEIPKRLIDSKVHQEDKGTSDDHGNCIGSQGNEMKHTDLRDKQTIILRDNRQFKPKQKLEHTMDSTLLHSREEHNFYQSIEHTQDSVGIDYLSQYDLEVEQDDIFSPKPVNEHGTGNEAHKRNSVMKSKDLSGEREKKISTLNMPMTTIKQILPNAIPFSKKDHGETDEKTHTNYATVKRNLVAKSSVDKRTRGLVIALEQSASSTSKLIRLDELCKQFLQYPESRAVAVKENITQLLLKICDQDEDKIVSKKAREALALVGHVRPVKGRRIRILCMDGGGTRGLVTLEMMKRLEEACGKPLHEMFDFVCGVSTGALIAIMVNVFRVPLEECEQIYKDFSSQMFDQNKLEGARKLVMSHAYYSKDIWEKILRENIGEKSFLETTRDVTCPKICVVSNIVNQPKIENFMFRNYNFPIGVESHYPGSCEHKLWESIRASSAAPGYYEEFKLGHHIHQDGGLLTNNPTALAIHECRLLWPDSHLQCVVSLGTGKFSPMQQKNQAYSSLRDILSNVVQSATDTESVHTILMDLLPPSTYFRLNPYLSEDFMLDEIRKDKWNKMIQDTQMYCRKNDYKIQMAVKQLNLKKDGFKRLTDWMSLTHKIKH